MDHLLLPEKISQQELQLINNLFSEKIYELEKVVENSAKVLSELTQYTAVVLGPTVKENKLNRFQIIPLNEGTAVAIIVTNTGHIENKIFSLPDSINPSDLEKTVNILNERLFGVPIADLQTKLVKEVYMLLKENVANYEHIYQTIVDVLSVPPSEKLYYSGKINMLKQPEFKDVDKVQEILEFIEEEEDFYQLLKETPFGIHVKIGSENKVRPMDECSLITATYNIGDEQVGTIAILGPKRMNYAKVISVLNLFSKTSHLS